MIDQLLISLDQNTLYLQFEWELSDQYLIEISGLMSISSIHFHVPFHDYKAGDLHVFFAHRFKFQIIDYDMIYKYIIHKFNLYTAANNEDCNH